MIVWFKMEGEGPDAVGVARLAVQIGDVLLRNVILRENGDGGFRIIPPGVFGRHALSAQTVKPMGLLASQGSA